MSVLPLADNTLPDGKNSSTPTEKKPQRARRKGKNLAQIHAKPLPLEIHPLPAFHPSNPISLLRLVYTWLSDILFSATSHPIHNAVGYFSPETRSVHVTDPACARVLWQMGFFGKGTLSRSEPSWLAREEARVREERSGANGRLAAEDWTRARREERRLFKLERARLEKEKIERQRLIEEGKLDPLDAEATDVETPSIDEISTTTQDLGAGGDSLKTILPQTNHLPLPSANGSINGISKRPESRKLVTTLQTNTVEFAPVSPLAVNRPPGYPDQESDEEEERRGRQIENQEHLQLTFEESFFLCYGLGMLSIHPAKRRDPSPLSVKSKPQPYSTADLLELFCQYSSFPALDAVWITPDDQFLLNYVAYHHFRSRGWVVRPGQKFGVDYLLYNRGPVFAHAEFAVVVVPAYTERYWNTPGGRARRRVWEQKNWWWLHCVNRVQTRVFKTLVLCYIDIPSELDMDFDEGIDVGKLLRSYRVREFVVRRWLPNRSRD